MGKRMTGEMAQSEVTREAFPGLFALRDSLKRRGIKSHPRAFDQYHGPYLIAENGVRAWIADVYYLGISGPKPTAVTLFLIESGIAAAFETEGAEYVVEATERDHAHGVYTLRQASKRISGTF